jgi:anti-anti-sigma factor
MLKPMVEVKNEAGVMVAEFWDCLRLDPVPVQDLRSKFEAHLRNGGRPELVVDLNGVGFAGSAALGGFVGIHRLAKQHAGRLIFCNVDPTVQEVMRVSKLETLFSFVADRAAALAIAQAAPPSADSAPVAAAAPPTGTAGNLSKDQDKDARAGGSGTASSGPAPPLRGRGRKR